MSTRYRFVNIGSLVILAGLIAFIGYSAFHRTGITDIEREQLSKLEDRWALDFDIVNRDEIEHAYIIKVDTGDPSRQPLQVEVAAGMRFRSTTYIFPQNVKGNEITLEVYRDSKREPIQVSRYYLIDEGQR